MRNVDKCQRRVVSETGMKRAGPWVNMAMGAVALLGNLNIDHEVFDAVAAEFDCDVEQATSLSGLRKISAVRNIVAVLFDAPALGLSWKDALKFVMDAAPSALPIVCAGFSHSIPWPELADDGAYHLLRLPIDESEVRHSLGFIWAAKRAEPHAMTLTAPRR
jgi:hypothetical protein